MRRFLGLVNAVFFEKGYQFLDAEVGEDVTVPIEAWSFGLARELDHFLQGFAITRDHKGLDFDFLAVEISDDFVAPRAAGFDIEDWKVHGVWGKG